MATGITAHALTIWIDVSVIVIGGGELVMAFVTDEPAATAHCSG